ncbi:hypothetical protein P3T76_011503 [Phytophthora citrophthora]|uniref:Uncharacterized protein n=1 Tax=Phytophthora citrophthora TaxID=4793 RepID=A0AAD9G9K0_9STRA|nr:hypothetical protein P3T76_011503 [Phytophthora citrophthora]
MQFVPDVGSEVMELALELELFDFLEILLMPRDEVEEPSLELADTVEPAPELEVPDDSLAELLLSPWRVTMTAAMTPMTATTTTTPMTWAFLLIISIQYQV